MDTLFPFGGFKRLRDAVVDHFLRDIDWETEMLLCHPLARPGFPSTNPVYDYRPSDPNARAGWKKIRDVGAIYEYKDGLIIRGSVETDILGDDCFLCAEVELGESSTGWINIAKRKVVSWNSQWLMFCQLQLVSRCRCGECKVEWLKHGWHCQRNRRQR